MPETSETGVPPTPEQLAELRNKIALTDLDLFLVDSLLARAAKHLPDGSPNGERILKLLTGLSDQIAEELYSLEDLLRHDTW